MATSAGEVEVTLTLNADDFKRMIGESQQNVQSFNSTLQTIGTTLVAVFSFAKIASFFQQSIQAYADNQLAVAKLVATLEAHGIASEQLVTHLEAQAKALETLYGIQQVNITSTQTMLASYGLQGAVLDAATKAAVEFTVRTGSLEASTNLLAKAFEGNTTMLKRYGLTVDQTLDPGKQFLSLLTQIGDKFGPAAAAQAGTFTGKLADMSNAFTHLKEEIGKLLSGPASGVLSWLKTQIEYMTQVLLFLNQISAATHSFTDVVGGILITVMQTVVLHMINILGVMVEILSHIPLIGAQFTALSNQINFMKSAIQALQASERAAFLQSVADSKIVQANQKAETDGYTNDAQKHMDVSAAVTAFLANQHMLSKEDFLKSLKDEDQGFQAFVDSFVTTQKQMWSFAGGLADTFSSGVGDGFAKMVVEGKNFSDSMKALFKDMAEQMISFVIQVILKMLILLALESATGVGAVAVPAFGAMAAGGVISEPSVMIGLRSGNQTLVGEAGPEIVSPMSGGTQGGSADAGGGGNGGNVTINISGQFLEGDQASWRLMVNQQIIPAIRRATMSNPTGPFNRTRGVV